MIDTLALFRTFVRVFEAGSFTTVARETATSQPTVSRQIALLEDHLGCRLFNRTTRALSPTDDGRVLYDHARRTLESLVEAESAVGRRRGEPSGRLKLACSVVFGRLQLVPRLPRFMARHPGIEIDLVMSDGFSDLVEEGIDLAIRVGEVTDAALVARRIGTTRRAVLATRDYLARHGAPAHPRDLADHICIVYERLATGANWAFSTPEGPLTVPISGPLRVNNTEGVRAAVLAGLGIGYVPVWHFVEGEIESGRLVVLLEAFEPPRQPISAVYPSRRFLAPKVRAAIDFLVEEFARDAKLAGVA